MNRDARFRFATSPLAAITASQRAAASRASPGGMPPLVKSAVMVHVGVEGDRAVFQVEGLHRMWAMRSRLEIPLAHITGVETDPAAAGSWWHGWKLMGTDVWGVFAAGTFYYHGELVFWDVRDPARAVIVSLDDERYKKLIIEVANPDDVVSRLSTALGRSTR